MYLDAIILRQTFFIVFFDIFSFIFFFFISFIVQFVERFLLHLRARRLKTIGIDALLIR